MRSDSPLPLAGCGRWALTIRPPGNGHGGGAGRGRRIGRDAASGSRRAPRGDGARRRRPEPARTSGPRLHWVPCSRTVLRTSPSADLPSSPSALRAWSCGRSTPLTSTRPCSTCRPCIHRWRTVDVHHPPPVPGVPRLFGRKQVIDRAVDALCRLLPRPLRWRVNFGSCSPVHFCRWRLACAHHPRGAFISRLLQFPPPL